MEASMISFPPKPANWSTRTIEQEIQALREYRDKKDGRKIPRKSKDRLLVATWNIANLGLQKRTPKSYKIIAEIVGWFDVVAVQEVADDLSGLRALQQDLPKKYRVLFSDKAGNDERAAFIYDGKKIKLQEKVGEVAVCQSEHRHIHLPGIDQEFGGFDRNPYIASFKIKDFVFLLMNAHLYFGSEESEEDENRRALEAFAAARWADLRHDDKHAYTKNIIVLGDFNLPKYEPGDAVYEALRRRGLRRPKHSTQVCSMIASDNHYDQILCLPGAVKQQCTDMGIFDFDGAVFSDLYNSDTAAKKKFKSYVKYYVSDHRPMWAAFNV
jgi:endonuclease/exonuclease/phosphatase family metal-dependent hydrolase